MDSIAPDPADPAAEVFTSDVRVKLYAGSRADLRPLFELAEDSPTQLDYQVDGSPGPDA